RPPTKKKATPRSTNRFERRRTAPPRPRVRPDRGILAPPAPRPPPQRAAATGRAVVGVGKIVGICRLRQHPPDGSFHRDPNGLVRGWRPSATALEPATGRGPRPGRGGAWWGAGVPCPPPGRRRWCPTSRRR